ncbi:Mechanosensitive ion channel protein 5 [Hibiscus syriacus]|uniref:Mechanosensitive ion channel protein n=1 Tax=Hibiscus syriacus TaxID=106335 RepID=A0A6A3B954_HIBSY|nr:mechanosensitive ion channel protein 6-like [Hibiscus syriacus]XP_039072180.1 mechanosensitive ion channel protein 6-like [Hibiscus syriacus]KAE8713614.1 Mechanosensitive ion channel protein 5 [Hibiscus syriacus]
MVVNSGDQKETILNIEDRSNDGSILASGGASTAGGGKIWRESSYDFWDDSEKIENNWQEANGNMNGTGSSGKNSINRESEGFDFMQSKQAAMDDPPSKLIGQFLHKQKASGEFSLDMDLEMDELQQEPPHLGGVLPTVSESPSPTAAALPRASLDNYPVRRRSSKGSPSPRKEDDGVVKCSSNCSSKRSEGGIFPRTSNLLATRTKSRLMDPPTQEKGEPKSAKSGAGKSRQITRSGFLGKSMDEEEDDSLLEEDLPDEYKRDKFSVLVLLEWLSLILIIAGLVCSLTIPYLKKKSLWKLMLWKWEVMVLVLICGRLVSGWIIKIIVFFIERNFLLRKKVLYFVYGVRKPVRNCLWLGLVLIAWHFLFDKKVQRETNSTVLRFVTKVLACLLVGVILWLVKTLLVKVLASSFHMSTYFDRIQDSLFNQYVIETLSGPPLIEIQRAEEEEERVANEVMSLQKAGATIPPGLKTSTISSPLYGKTTGSEWIQKTPRGKSLMLSPARALSAGTGDKDDKGITIDHLHKLNHKNVSAWNMKRLMNIIRHGALSTLDEQIQDSAFEDESARQIRNEYEAKVAARKIFQNVAKPGSRFIYLEDIGRFLPEDEALKTVSLFEGASESKRISKKALKNWVVNAFRERRALALTLNDTKTAVNKLHRMVDVLVGIVIFIIWLLILEIASSKVLVFISSQLLLVAFIFGNTCKTIFEAIIFLFVMHPFDVGDRCEIDGVQMIVEEMNILTTVFLRYDNQRIIIPNSVLATKAINNYYRSPDMLEIVEFCIHVKTPAEKIGLMKQRILSYIEHRSDHWYQDTMIILKELEVLNRVRIAIWVTHRMNHQDMGERFTRRALLIEELVRVFNELDIKYRLYPIDINVCGMPPMASDHLPPTWSGPAS